MRWGISGAPLPDGLIYGEAIAKAASERNFPPCFLYAIGWNESIRGEKNGSWDAATIISFDNGHGIFQLTSSWPDGWEDPYTNALYAIDHFLLPAVDEWLDEDSTLQGDDLVRCVAAAFNAGFNGALSGHQRGDVDLYTTDHYARRILATYHELIAGEQPS